MSLLSVDGRDVNFGQLTALRGVSLNLAEGQTLFVTGPNGAGKSTLLKVIAGTVRARSGRVSFADRSDRRKVARGYRPAGVLAWCPRGARSSTR